MGEAVEAKGCEEAPFGVGSTDFLNPILPSAIRVNSRPFAVPMAAFYPNSLLITLPKNLR
jgi:hypothetical protein